MSHFDKHFPSNMVELQRVTSTLSIGAHANMRLIGAPPSLSLSVYNRRNYRLCPHVAYSDYVPVRNPVAGVALG
jgi:hypothetical protein